jgi:hypothetical protein
MSAAISAKGTTLKIGSTAIVEVLKITGPGLKVDTQDVTSHASTAAWKEFVPTLKEAGEVGFDINYVPSEATHKNASGGLVYLLANMSSQTFNLVFPDTTTWTFTGFVVAFTVDAAHDGILKATCSIKITGQPTLV